MPHTGSFAAGAAGAAGAWGWECVWVCELCDAMSSVPDEFRPIPAGGMLDMYTLAGYVSTMDTKSKSARLKRLSRIEGQVRGLSRMVDEDRYCIDIVTQIAAVRAALAKVEEDILQDHISHCVEHAIASGNADEQRKKVAELMEVLGRTRR